MPVEFFRFGEFAPDRSRFNPGASASIINAKPGADGYLPMASLSGLSSALPSQCLGGVAFVNDAGTAKIFAGTATGLYELETDLTWTNVTRASGAYNLDAAVDRWEFVKFKNYLIATQINDRPQFIETEAGTQFADLTNASFNAAHVWTAGEYVVFGNLDTDNRKIKWSGINDPFYWTIGLRGSDEQIMPTGGPIQGGIEQASDAIVFQRDRISDMQFDPVSDLVFRFVTINPNRGVFAPRSLVNIGPDDYVYLSKDGFFRGRAGTPIGAERVDKWFFDTCDPDYLELVRAVADPYDKIVWFRFQDEGGTNYLLGYDWQVNKWMYSTSQATELMEGLTTGYSLEDLDAFGTIDTLPYSLDSRFWQGGIPGFAGFTTDHKFGFFNGSNLQATIDSELKRVNGSRRAIVTEVEVMANTDSYTVAGAGIEKPGSTPSFGSAISPETGHPWCPMAVSGRYHKFRTVLAAGAVWHDAIGLNVKWEDDGEY